MTVSAGFTVHSNYYNPVGLTSIQLKKKHGLQGPLSFWFTDILQKKVYDTPTKDNMTSGMSNHLSITRRASWSAKKLNKNKKIKELQSLPSSMPSYIKDVM